ncbi:TM2 domain-containing protein [Fusarium sp. LHS14.1]|nr:TM2 domain-containing protein [Fusarium sp. LHS14.1]
MEHTHAGFADKVGRGVAKGVSFALGKWKQLLFTYTFTTIVGIALLYMHTEHEASLVKRSWGGFDERPMTEKCYRQERTAMLLSLFLGVLGVDQFYAHHWPLAIFKFLTLGGLGTWAFVDMILWIVGGVYGTPGCPGGSPKGWQY